MKIEELYDARGISANERLKAAKNIVLLVPDANTDVSWFLDQVGLDRHEVAVSWPKAGLEIVDEVSVIAPKVVIQLGAQTSRRYPFLPDGTEVSPELRKKIHDAIADKFVALHHHDEYSLKDGLGTVDQLVKLLKKQRRSFCCVTNHGSVGGWIKQYNACHKAGIKPIFGMEAYFSDYRGDDPEIKKAHRSANHLILLARTKEGFDNIIRIHNDAQLEGFYYSPRVNFAALEQWGKGVIGTSACMAGMLPRLLMDGKTKEAEAAFKRHANSFDEFYIELQIIEFELQREVNRRLIEFGNAIGAPFILAADSHYLDPDHADTHDLLMYIRQGKTKLDVVEKDEDVWDFEVRNLFYRNDTQMRTVFNGGFVERAKDRRGSGESRPAFKDEVFTEEIFDKAMNNTLSVARRVENIKMDKSVKLPKLYADGEKVLRDKTNEGFKRLGLNKRPDRQIYIDRIRHEYEVICKLGWADYFLVMEKIITMAKTEFVDEVGEFATGYGRGSAAGCLIAWCLGLTECDPIEHGLLFERFLDSGRPDPPDIDTDFHPAIHSRVKQRIVEMFGESNTCNIGTYSTYKTRMAIMDTARALGYDVNEANAVTKEMDPLRSFENEDGDDEMVDKMDFDELFRHYPALKAYIDKYQEVRVHAEIIRNQIRNMGKHAAGVIISDMDLRGKIPVQRDNSGNIISSWAESGSSAELSEVGLVKYDILGLNNLPVIADCVRLVKKHRGITIKRSEIPLDDHQTIRLESKGDLKGIFQFENPGTKPIVNAVGMESLNDVSAITSLLRPGPKDMGMHMEYAERKNGAPYNIIPCLEPVLKDTYGILCLHKDTYVSLANGGRKKISDITKGDIVLSLNRSSNKIEEDICDGCGPTRICNGLKITFDNGYSVVLTEDHKVLTNNGMIECSKLNTESIVAFGFNCNVSGGKPISSCFGNSEDVSYLLGFMIGDAQISTSVTLCIGSEILCDKMIYWLNTNIKNIKTNKFFHCRAWYVGISSELLLNEKGFGNRKTVWHHFLESMEMKKTCYQKSIPEEIIESDAESRLAFIAGLIDSDGCITKRSNDGSEFAFITSVSEDIIDGFCHLLRGFGFSHTRSKNRVHIYGKDFARAISSHLVLKKVDICLWSNGDRINWWSVEDVRNLVLSSGMSLRKYTEINKLNRGFFRRKVCHTSTAQKWGVNTGDIRFAKVKKIEEAKECQFYGMSVRRNRNLIANGMIVSNCYQEQFMQISRILCGFDGPMQNRLRKACGKKIKELMVSIREAFVNGAQPRIDAGEVTLKEVEDLWSQIVSFAAYGFNKSHAVTYSMITTCELWLKHNFFREYMCALLLNTKGGKKSHTGGSALVEYINYTRKRGVEVLPPDINATESDFHIDDKTIRFGMAHVKNVASAAENIAKIATVKTFESMTDFYERCEYESEIKSGANAGKARTTKPSKKVVESLIYAGVFDRFGDRNTIMREYIVSSLGAPQPTDEELADMEEKALKGCTVKPHINGPGTAMEAIKGVGEVGLHIAAIAAEKPFESMADFCERCVYENAVKGGKNAGLVRETKPTKKVVETLIYAGAFDTFGSRCKMFRDYYAAKKGIDANPLSEEELDMLEVDMIGMCLSKPPLFKRFSQLMKKNKWVPIGDHENYRKVVVFGRVEMVEARNSKAGNPMFVVRMNDGMSSIDFFVFMGGMQYFRDMIKKGLLAAIPLDKFQDSFTRFFDDNREITVVTEEGEIANA